MTEKRKTIFPQTISFRLFSALTLVSSGLFGIVIYTTIQLNMITAQLQDAVHRLLPELVAVSDSELNLTRMSLQIRHAMLVRTPQDLEATIQDIGAKQALIEKDIAFFAEHAKSPQGKLLSNAIGKGFDVFKGQGRENIRIIREGDEQRSFEYLVSTVIPARNQLLANLDKAVSLQQEMLANLVTEAEDATAWTKNVLAVSASTLVVLFSFLVWTVVRSIKSQISSAAAVSEQIADGDLSQRIKSSRQDEFLPLLQSLEKMRESLTAIVWDVRKSSDGIATGASEIAAGTADLSRRTELQASNLEETAASMEQLSATVKQSAETAAIANNVASEARDAAIQGGDVVTKVATTMNEIAASSNRISDITNVIEGIAFQTNILALNAAVEAARAGEQGRGFAVVATEVRSLAQRSSTAAREIKDLIADSVTKVQNGTQYAEVAKTSMDDIVSRSKKVSDLIHEISTATVEQSLGIQQVGTAVTQLDEVTQQNAALVEQSTAASESLDAQAKNLVQAVSVFKL